MKSLSIFLLFSVFVNTAQAIQCNCSQTYQENGTGVHQTFQVWTQCPGSERWDLDCRAQATSVTLTATCSNLQTGQQMQNTNYLGGYNWTPVWGNCTIW